MSMLTDSMFFSSSLNWLTLADKDTLADRVLNLLTLADRYFTLLTLADKYTLPDRDFTQLILADKNTAEQEICIIKMHCLKGSHLVDTYR